MEAFKRQQASHTAAVSWYQQQHATDEVNNSKLKFRVAQLNKEVKDERLQKEGLAKTVLQLNQKAMQFEEFCFQRKLNPEQHGWSVLGLLTHQQTVHDQAMQALVKERNALEEALQAKEMRDLEQETVKKALYSSAAKHRINMLQAQLAASKNEIQALRAKPEAVTRGCQVGPCPLQDGQAPTVEVSTATVDGGRIEQLEEELARASVKVQAVSEQRDTAQQLMRQISAKAQRRNAELIEDNKIVRSKLSDAQMSRDREVEAKSRIQKELMQVQQHLLDSQASKALKMQQIHAEKLTVAADLQRSEVIKQRLLKQTSDLKDEVYALQAQIKPASNKPKRSSRGKKKGLKASSGMGSEQEGMKEAATDTSLAAETGLATAGPVTDETGSDVQDGIAETEDNGRGASWKGEEGLYDPGQGHLVLQAWEYDSLDPNAPEAKQKRVRRSKEDWTIGTNHNA